jgi:hypothetical protein
MRANFVEYIGLSVADAEAKANEQGTPFRIETEDGVEYALTMDFMSYRGNATVVNGVVTAMRPG